MARFPLAGRFRRAAASLCCCAALATVATAAEQSSAGEAFTETPNPAYLTLLMARDPVVHAELALSPKQKQAVMAAVAKADHPLWVLRDVPVKKCSEQLDALRGQLRESVGAALSPKQSQRFDQLVMQARGSKSLVAPDVQQRLRLAEPQIDQLRQIVAAAEGGTLDSKKVVSVLSPQQRNELSGLFGKRFDTSRVTYVGCTAPELRGVDSWINSEPLSLEELRGKVVAVHFWAFNCINCIRNLPHYQAWFEKFSPDELTIIGIHTPETSAERKVENLRANVKMRDIDYPVAFDGQAENWKAWGNNIWPAVYLIDKRGNVRAWWYGELNWQGATGEQQMRNRIAELIAEK